MRLFWRLYNYACFFIFKFLLFLLLPTHSNYIYPVKINNYLLEYMLLFTFFLLLCLLLYESILFLYYLDYYSNYSFEADCTVFITSRQWYWEYQVSYFFYFVNGGK